MTTFRGFGDAALELYAGLSADNSRSYWTQHRTTYDDEVREPMLALLAELADEFGPGKLFRPNRDIRFSTDKSPYKTHQAAFVGSGTPGVGYYLSLDADGLLAGGGWRAHEPSQIERYRAAVDEDRPGAELAELVGGLLAAGFDLAGDPLRTRPRGYPADHPRLDLLRNRSLMASRSFGAPAWLSTPRARDEVRAAWQAVRPLATWAERHVGGG